MKRIAWIDELKGLAIMLIVAGHVVATLGNMTTGSAQELMHNVFKFIYSFHVPLFFVLAGLTFSAKDGFGPFAKKKFMRLMVPYYVWGFVSAAIYVVMGNGIAADMQSVSTTTSFAEKTLHAEWWVPFVSIIHAGTWPEGKGFCFNGVLWFLPVMFAGELIFYWIARVCRRSAQSFLAFAILAALMLWIYPFYSGFGSVRYVPFNIPMLVHYLPCIALGYCFSLLFLRDEQCGWKSVWRDVAFWVGVALLLYFVLVIFSQIARERSAYHACWLLRSLPMIALLMLMAKGGVLKAFGFLAPLTLGVMIFHKFPLVIAQIALGKSHFFKSAFYLQHPSVIVVVTAILLTVGLTLLCYAGSKVIVRFIPWSLGVKGASR